MFRLQVLFQVLAGFIWVCFFKTFRYCSFFSLDTFLVHLLILIGRCTVCAREWVKKKGGKSSQSSKKAFEMPTLSLKNY